MKSTASTPYLVLTLLTLAAFRSSDAHAQEAEAPAAPPHGTVVILDSAAENTWVQLLKDLQSQPVARKTIGVGQTEKVPAIGLANRFRQFCIDYPGAPQSIEAQKLEALLLIDAVGDGAEAETERMEALVKSFRSNLAFSVSVRAEIAATYEYRNARSRIQGLDDVSRVYQVVARSLMAEFPDQPQGPGSLVTLADDLDEKNAKAIAQEVIDSAAPEEVKGRARAMVKRKAVVGRRVGDLFGTYTDINGGDARWSAGRPSVIYFWATWSPESLAVGGVLRDLGMTGINVLGVCLDTDVAAAEAAASKAGLPGRLVYLTAGLRSSLATDLGVVDVPTVFLSNRGGVFTDVKALNRLPEKIQALGN